jgi:hypothetical protein
MSGENTDAPRPDPLHNSAMSAPCVCPVCGDAIGVYEPVLVIDGGWARTSSLLREPLLGSGADVVIHRACGLKLGLHAPDDGTSTSAGPCARDG